MRKSHIVLVFGYGCHLVPGLKGYLDRVRRFCNQNQPDTLVFCGGYTQRKTAPGLSEAQVMWSYLKPHIPAKIGVICESDSYTTLDNAQKASKLLIRGIFNEKETDLTVFCEATQAAEVDMVIRHFFGRRACIETASWELAAPEKRIIPMIWTWLSLKSPRLAAHRCNQRIERSYQI